MKIYLAGYPGIKSRALIWTHFVNNALFSYHTFVEEKLKIWLREYFFYWHNMIQKMKESENKVQLFLDSGAYSALTQNTVIDIQEYIQFIKDHQDVIHVYANLDVICQSDGRGKKSTQALEQSARASFENQMIMERAGLNPIPCFHLGENPKWLKRYLDRGYDYIAIGGSVGTPSNILIKWFDELFSEYLTDDQGMPRVKLHAFGVTSLVLMTRYPWYSVDSTSWVVTSRMGMIYVPRFKGGEWIYDENSWKITVSSKSPTRKEKGEHIDTLSPDDRGIILNYIHDKGYELGASEFRYVDQSHKPEKGVESWAEKKPESKSKKRLLEIITKPGISNKYQLRDELNIIYFSDLEKSMPAWPWPFQKERRQQSLNF
jgi:hypothetical protein